MKRSPSELVRIPALAARALGDQAARAVDAGRVELHELHVLQRQAGARHHAAAVTGAGVGGGGAEIGAAVTAGGQHHRLARKQVHRAFVQLPGPARRWQAPSVMIRSSAKYSMKNARLVRQRLPVKRVQDGVAGAVGGGAGALHRRAFAELGWCGHRRGADRSCPLRCAKTARRNVPARRPPAGASRAGIPSRRYRPASPTP